MAWAGTSRTELAPCSVWEWRCGAGGGLQGWSGGTQSDSAEPGEQEQGCQPRAIGSKVALGRQSWLHHVGGTEGSRKLLRDDLDGLNRTGTKRAPPLCLDMRET